MLRSKLARFNPERYLGFIAKWGVVRLVMEKRAAFPILPFSLKVGEGEDKGDLCVRK